MIRWSLVLAVIVSLVTSGWANRPQTSATTPTPGGVASPVAAILVPQLGHQDEVTSVAFAPDGRTLASGSKDQTVKLWDMGSEALMATLRPEDGVASLAFAPDGTLASAGRNITLWDLQTHTVRRTIKTGNDDPLRSLAFSPDGRVLAGAGKAVQLWDLQKATLLGTLQPGTTSLAFAPDGKLLATVTSDGVNVWDPRFGRLLKSLPHPRASTLAASPGGRLASGSIHYGQGEVRLWDASTWQVRAKPVGAGIEAQPLSALAKPAVSLAFSPDGTVIAIGGPEGTVTLWETRSGKTRVLDPSAGRYVFSVAFSPLGDALAAGYGDSKVRLWDVPGGRPPGGAAQSGDPRLRTVLLGQTADGMEGVAFSPDGSSVATAHRGLTLWDARTGRAARRLNAEGYMELVAFSSDGKWLATGGRVSRTVTVWGTGDWRARKLDHANDVSMVTSIAFSTDGKLLASGAEGRLGFLESIGASGVPPGHIRVWDFSRGKVLWAQRRLWGNVSSLAFSPDGKALASAWLGVNLWDPQTGQSKAALTTSVRPNSVTFSQDGRRLAAEGFWDEVIIWDAATGVVERKLRVAGGVGPVLFSPDGTLLAIASQSDGIIQLWDAQIWALRRTIKVRGPASLTTAIHRMAFSQDGKILAAGTPESLRLYYVSSGTLVATLLVFPTAENEDITWITFTPESYYDASPGAKRYIRWLVAGRIFPAEAYERVYRRPDLLQRALHRP